MSHLSLTQRARVARGGPHQPALARKRGGDHSRTGKTRSIERLTQIDSFRADIRTQVVQLSWQTFTSTPKSEAGQRTITLDADTVPVLRGWKKFQNQARLKAGAEWSDSGLVFTRQNGQGWHPSHVSDWFARIARAAGLPPITLHGLRHGAASMALAAGTDVKVVSAELGHSTAHFT